MCFSFLSKRRLHIYIFSRSWAGDVWFLHRLTEVSHLYSAGYVLSACLLVSLMILFFLLRSFWSVEPRFRLRTIQLSCISYCLIQLNLVLCLICALYFFEHTWNFCSTQGEKDLGPPWVLVVEYTAFVIPPLLSLILNILIAQVLILCVRKGCLLWLSNLHV